MARDKKKVSRKKNERLPFIFAPQSVERSVHALCERKKDAPGNKETARRPYQSSSSHPPPAAASALPDVPRVVYTHSENEQYTFPLVGKTCCFLHLDRLFIFLRGSVILDLSCCPQKNPRQRICLPPGRPLNRHRAVLLQRRLERRTKEARAPAEPPVRRKQRMRAPVHKVVPG